MKIFTGLLIGLSFIVTGLGQESAVPFVSHGVVVGGVEKGRWLSAKEIAPLLKDEIDIRLIGIDGLNKDILRGTKGHEAEVCSETSTIDLGKRMESAAIGSAVSWEPFPRKHKALPVSNRTYQKIVSDIRK